MWNFTNTNSKSKYLSYIYLSNENIYNTDMWNILWTGYIQLLTWDVLF